MRFPARTREADTAVIFADRGAAAGTLDFSRPRKLEYRFRPAPPIDSPSSLQIEYIFSVPPPEEIKDRYQLVLKAGGESWALPMDLAFLGIDAGGASIHYAVPLAESFSGQFSVSLAPAEPGLEKSRSRQPKEKLPRFQIRSVTIRDRWFGYYHPDSGGEERFFASPFVFREDDGRYAAVPPPVRSVTRNTIVPPEITVGLSSGKTAVLETGGFRFEASSHLKNIRVSSAMLSANSAVAVSGDRVRSFQMTYPARLPFPQPIETDPGLIIAWPREQWRDRRYEIFRWEQFPSLLIFDTADYAVQDRMLKRLAFFTEKAGFQGRLVTDDEIADLHGWNAHDYRAEDLARFFDAARSSGFPLSAEERELETILRNEGIIRAAGGVISAGEGGIISISRESPDYLRTMFMVHEAFHGLFFIDEDFRAFSRRRWEHLPAQAKRFIVSYFDYQHYDIKNEYLLVNEFMAHILQQPVSRAGRYFGETLASRIDASSWRRTVLPAKDEAAGTWPVLAEVFTREAEAFSAYVNQRWGLAAGRVRQITVRDN